jgi:hypothetical protein
VDTGEDEMSKMSDMAYDIEQLYIEGYSAKTISIMLECPVDVVYGWIEGNGVADQPQLEDAYSEN